ncbi:MAG: hypothetical protein IJ557_02435 [Bacteroidaceae bacterium]|nr:hypothetical protein [Bacteroidaceae bacterium]
MAKIRDGYLEKLDKYLLHGYKTLDHIAMTAEQKLRTQIVYEAYQVWVQNKQVRPMDLCRRISERVYEQMLIQAARNPKIADFVAQCGIESGKKRSVTALYNDVQAFNYIVGKFDTPVTNIEKAKVVDASDWLIEHGMQTGDGRDVGKGADLKMRLNNDFDERQQATTDLAQTDISIVGDVSIVKHDRVNLSEEERQRISQKFGLSTKEVTTLVENRDGVWVPNQDEHDIYEE